MYVPYGIVHFSISPIPGGALTIAFVCPVGYGLYSRSIIRFFRKIFKKTNCDEFEPTRKHYAANFKENFL